MWKTVKQTYPYPRRIQAVLDHLASLCTGDLQVCVDMSKCSEYLYALEMDSIETISVIDTEKKFIITRYVHTKETPEGVNYVYRIKK